MLTINHKCRAGETLERLNQLRQFLVGFRLVFKDIESLVALNTFERDLTQYRIIDRICDLYLLSFRRLEIRQLYRIDCARACR